MNHIHQPLYRFVLRDALRITWHNKFLWFLGFFVALLGNGGAYEIIIKSVDRTVLKALLGGGEIPSIISALTKLKNLVLQSASVKPILEFVLIIVLLIVLAALYFLFSSAAMTATILAVKKLRHGKITMLESLRESLPHLPHVFGINVLTKMLVALLVAVSALPLGWLFLKSRLAFGAIYVLVFVVLMALGLIISFVSIYAACNSVFGANHILNAFREAWHIFRKNVITSVEIAVLLFFLNLAVSVILLAILVSVGGIFGLILTLLSTAKLNVIFWVVTVVSVLFFAVLLILTGSFFGAFQLVSWTILYTKLVRGEALSKIVRLAAHLPRYLKFKQT